jgi:hypothetical protein
MKIDAINAQYALIENNSVAMAVVDYGLAWRRSGATARYGVRGLSHVEQYNLNAIRFNEAATQVHLSRVQF